MGTPFSIETLMSVAAIGALVIGEAPEAAIVVFLFATGELLEGVAAGRARAGIAALLDLVPRTAQRISGETVETVPVEALVPGDLVMVRPGDRVPSDGEVRDCTYLVCGVRGLAGLGASFRDDPAAFTRLMQQMLSPLMDQALAHGGTIDRLTADAVARARPTFRVSPGSEGATFTLR